jgi:hypothetical protein
MSRPLLFLDVDGPLNPYAAQPERRPEGYTTIRATVRPGRPLRVWLNPSHGPALLSLDYDHRGTGTPLPRQLRVQQRPGLSSPQAGALGAREARAAQRLSRLERDAALRVASPRCHITEPPVRQGGRTFVVTMGD